jgi:hypothetical protein
MNKNLNKTIIISLLHKLDALTQVPCRIIIGGGAAAIIGYGLNRVTGDIDIFEPIPKNSEIYSNIKKISKDMELDPKWMNDGTKGFITCLAPSFIKRLIPLNEKFKTIEVYLISKADFLTLKLSRWDESDKDDVKILGIEKEDLGIIAENLLNMDTYRPDQAQKIHFALMELGIEPQILLQANQITSLAELVMFSQQQGADPEINTILEWKDKIKNGEKPQDIAGFIINKDKKI